ncbi:MAG: DNA topology modulation protein [Oscillospiraceae bacterium]|nr:DNA topology modulation protein [Oscillospiraceae bacterium]
MKIAIVGYSGSGKSTTAQKLGEKFNIPVLYLDSVHWMENWTERPHEESKTMVADFMAKNDSWVIDGNYKTLLQAERFEQADMILFFSFNRFTCLYRVVKRWLKYRGTSRPDIAQGCNEKIDFEFVRWVLWDGRTPRKRRGYENMCKKYSNKVVILKNQRQLDDFLQTL